MTNSLLSLILTLLLSTNVSLDYDYYRDKYIAENTQAMSIMFIGDIMVHDPQYISAYNNATGQYDFTPWFSYMTSHFEQVDLVMGNLETTLTERNDVSGYPMFHSPYTLADALKGAGFDIVGTANNHSLDNRTYGIETTLKHLRRVGLLSTGTYLPEENASPLVIEQNGIKLGIIASTYGTNGMPLPKDAPHVVNLNDLTLYQTQIEQLKAQQVDGIVAFIHWGYEYKRAPHFDQVEFAKQLSALDVDWIIGSHPHSIQPDDFIDPNGANTYVVYSLGNAISNQQWRYSDTGLAVTLHLKKQPDVGLFTEKVSYLPFWVDKFMADGSMVYTMIPLLDTPQLDRLSADDQRRMQEALADFYELYPHAQTQ